MHIQNILVPIDFSPPSQEALLQADSLAYDYKARLIVLHVYAIVEISLLDFTYVESAEHISRVCEAAENHLKDWLKPLRTPTENIQLLVETGSPVEVIVEKSKDSDLLVIGTHGRTGVAHFFLGSTAERVVRESKCPIWVAKKKVVGV